MFEPDHQVYGFTLDFPILTYFKNYTIHPDNKINRLKRSLLPFFYIFQNCTCDVRYRTFAYFNTVYIFNGSFDITGTHASGIHSNNSMFNLLRHALMLGNNNRIKGCIAISWDIQRNFSKVCLQSLATGTITAIAAVFTGSIVFRITKMFTDFCLQKSFYSLFVKLLKVRLKLLLCLNLF